MPSGLRAPQVGAWLVTCRAGFEPFLYEELAWAGAGPQLLGPGLLSFSKQPKETPAFARAAFPVSRLLQGADSVRDVIAKVSSRPAALHLWAPDTDVGNRSQVQTLFESGAEDYVLGPQAAEREGGVLIEVCEYAPDQYAFGTLPAHSAWSLWPGGKRRMKRSDAPSRAAMKLDEALDRVSVPPGRGDVCVDLGAAPGGWTARLVDRGAKVIAVDPAKLTPELSRHPKVKHVQDSAFTFQPEEQVDWLFCDMAWRPLEVAQLLAKWARKHWALQLCANIKLPMNDKLPIIHRVKRTLLEGGWNALQVRQLYHDRDEVTVLANC
ncbi:MAG: SAM-dependent methyltransferase [Myxococcaceae bacterium]